MFSFKYLNALPMLVSIWRRYCRFCRTGWAKNWPSKSCSYLHQIL